jgi:predicted RND superfamily exporter protein
MSGWPSRILAVFSIIWGLIVIASVIFNSLASNYMMSPEYGWIDAIKSNAIILTIGVAVWYGVFRLTRWFDERS